MLFPLGNKGLLNLHTRVIRAGARNITGRGSVRRLGRQYPVLADPFSGIERRIGTPQQRLGGFARLPLRQPCAEMDRHALFVQRQRPLRQRALQAQQGGHAVRRRCFRQQQDELVAAQPGDGIAAAQVQLADRHQVAKHRIATGVAVQGIGLMEVVQIQQRQRQRMAVAAHRQQREAAVRGGLAEADAHPLTWRLRDDGEPVWLDEYQAKAMAAAEEARKTAAHSALWMFVALLLGAFVASVTATIGGRNRDHARVIVRLTI